MMRKWKKMLLTALPVTLLFSFQVFAGQWKNDMNGWWYQEDDGSYLANGWYWLDGNGDGTAECYYFGKDGYMVKEHGYVDGYTVDENGAWMVDGKVQTKQVEPAAGDTAGTEDSGADTAALEVTDISGITDPVELYRIAARKLNSLDQVDGKLEMTMSETAYGMTIQMSMSNDFKMRGVRSGNLQYVSTGSITGFGLTVPISEFYTDGYYYTESSSRKYREPMSAEDALDETMFYDAYLFDEDDMEFAGLLKIRQEGENKILYLDMDQAMAKEELGFEDSQWTSYQVHDASVELVINPAGYCIAQRISVDVDETEYDPDYNMSMTTNEKMYALVTLYNPGQTVDLSIPSTAGYEEIYALQ